jgi:uncharacterized protein YdhG (YjbR/CyaY superfamily)
MFTAAVCGGAAEVRGVRSLNPFMILGRFNMKPKSTPPENIDAYIADFPPDVQRILREIRSVIRTAAPDAEEALKYRIPTFVLNGNLVHFAAFEKHIGFYPTPSGIEQFKDKLSAYPSAKGSVQFPLGKPIPFALIRSIVEYRVKEARVKRLAKPSRKSGK